MVRYPHTAIISSDNGQVVDGEYVIGELSEITVQGRFEASNSNSKIKLNIIGNEVIVRGTFYCSKQQLTGTKLVIESLGVDSKIICIEQFQTYTAIYV
jgi:exo-beta-1,3-glucanase (GH17 family)